MQEMRSYKNKKTGDRRALEDLQGCEVLMQKFLQINGSYGYPRNFSLLYPNHDWRKKRDAFHEETPAIGLVQSNAWLRTRSKLGKACYTCNKTGQTVIHHIQRSKLLTASKKNIYLFSERYFFSPSRCRILQ